ncbi:MAG: DMP19 family protein, partial [Burkholderiaceae bacterium]
MAAEERGEVSTELLDDLLWYFMTERGGPAESPDNSTGPIRDYVASRLIEWEVGNGGFAQAAYNCPEWLEAAAQGYDRLALPKAAERIREACRHIANEPNEFTKEPGTTIEKVFSEFSESNLSKLDEGLNEIGWWAIEKRIAYVRKNL